MTTVFSRNVADMSPQQRSHLEQVIGESLPPQGRVFVLASDTSTDSVAVREQAHERILAVMDKVKRYQQAVGITEEEADAVVDAAIEEVRRQRRS
jgi:hypothetical protein